MLLLHEVHEVNGRDEDAFLAAYRDVYMNALAEDDSARLAWVLQHAHGTGPAYHVVTITAVRDAEAWADLDRRVHGGDLDGWDADVSAMRRRVTGKVLLPVSWSPLQELDLDQIPTEPTDREPALFMEDTGWPHGALDDYIRLWDEDYYRPMEERGPRLLQIEACFQTAHGAGRRAEAILWQRVLSTEALHHLYTTHVPDYPTDTWPGSYMHDGLQIRDRWESKLLRTVPWSPLA